MRLKINTANPILFMHPPYEQTVHSVVTLVREPIFEEKSGEKWVFSG